MPVAVSYPGVYVEEIPSGVRTITGVATSVAAFIGYTARGLVNTPVQLFNYGDFERAFGGLSVNSVLSYTVEQFFSNGGSQAWVVRVAKGAAKAAIEIKNGLGGGSVSVLRVEAVSEGLWGNGLRIEVDHDTASPGSLFNLRVTELVDRGGVLQPARIEMHRNLSMSRFSSAYAVKVITAASNLISASRPAALDTAPLLANANGTSTSGVLTNADLALLGDNRRRLAITIDGDGPHEFDLFDAGGALAGADFAGKLADLCDRIEDRVRALKPAVPAFSAFTCAPAGGDRVLATSGTPDGEGERSLVRFSQASQRSATATLKLDPVNGGREAEGAAAIRPAQSGSVGNVDLRTIDLTTLLQPAAFRVTINAAGVADDGPHTVQLWTTRPTSVESLAAALQAAFAVSGKAELNQAEVTLVEGRLRIVPGGSNPNARFAFANASGTDTTAATIGLVAADNNVGRYAPGIGATGQAQTGAQPGSDGIAPDAAELKGSRLAKTGLFALEAVDLFNILCLPDQTDAGLLDQALAYAIERRAMLLADMPPDIDTVAEVKTWLSSHGSLRDPNATAYFPRIQTLDPLDGNRLRSLPNCGVVAGLYARTDASRGVWKAPAGIEAVLRGVQGLDYVLTDQENGVLNPLGINCLRLFPAFGPVAWGARTLRGADQLASEWKYIPVRRLALFLEESLYRGTQWVVFEPNDEPLWAQIRLNVGAFMNTLFRQGAFQGKTPREAYLVKCDAETTTQNDINLGIVNIVVGFAPLKPAEFVIIRIQQLAGQIQV